ncbi:acyl-CoA dehydrogenase family protein [Bacillus sp. JJ1533]|uniref:acyl-CoA dehydrogenase family protein n=1 Tax=Bacillus sp. JJ1533 TaxID=3122959 RepID=UPI002FFDEB76
MLNLHADNWFPEIQDEAVQFFNSQQEALKYIEQYDKIPKQIYEHFSNKGWFGILTEKRYGGIGLDEYAYAGLLRKIASFSSGLALNYAVHQVCLLKGIQYFGSNQLKEEVLPKASSGDKLFALCITEPGAGSDLSGIKTFAQRIEGGYSINGTKTLIVNAEYADYLLVAAIEDLVNPKKTMSLFIVENSPSNELYFEKINSLGNKGAALRKVHFRNVYVPEHHVLGNKGEGFKLLLNQIELDRIGGVVVALGIAEAAFQTALEYSKERKQFGKRIADFQGISFMLAEMASEIKVIDSLANSMLYEYKQGIQNSSTYSIGKLIAAKSVEKVTSMAIEICGGIGYTTKMPVERYYRDSKSVALGGGTIQIMKNIIGSQLLKS